MQICVAIPNQLLQLKSEPVAEAEAIAESLHTSLVTYITLVTKRRLVQQALVEPKLPAHALRPGGPVGAPDPRVSVRARYYLTGTHAPHAVEGPHLNGTEPQQLAQPNHASEDRSPRRSHRQGVCPHPRHTHPE